MFKLLKIIFAVCFIVIIYNCSKSTGYICSLYKNEYTDLHELTEQIVALQATDAIKADIDIGLDAKAPAYVFGKASMLSIQSTTTVLRLA